LNLRQFYVIAKCIESPTDIRMARVIVTALNCILKELYESIKGKHFIFEGI